MQPFSCQWEAIFYLNAGLSNITGRKKKRVEKNTGETKQ